VSGQSHSAAPSALGYLYQSQWPLLELLRGSPERPDCAITVELHDDVAWDEHGTPTSLLQLKRHHQSVRTLSDKDVDVWRTIRVWMDGYDIADPDGPTLTIVTTQTAAADNATAALRPHDRDPEEALRRLEIAARESTAEASRETRRRFLALSPLARDIFVRRMYVLDRAPDIGDFDGEVRRELWWALPRGYEDAFMNQLWSWWHVPRCGRTQAVAHAHHPRTAARRKPHRATIEDGYGPRGRARIPSAWEWPQSRS
jgi:hypothetical protein